MKENTKKALAICSGTAVSIALACVICTQFAKPEEEIATLKLPEQTMPSVTAAVSTTSATTPKPVEKDEPCEEDDEKLPTETDEEIPEEENDDTEYIEIDQSFPEVTKPAETTASTTPPPPVITDTSALTNPDKEPEYEPEQIKVTKPATQDVPAEKEDKPSNGDKKDGYIYLNGFGWVADRGGGGEAEYAEDMYENGNKIGYFG